MVLLKCYYLVSKPTKTYEAPVISIKGFIGSHSTLINFPGFFRSVFLFLDDLVAKLAVSLRYFHLAFPISQTLRFDAQLLYRI